MQLLPERTGNAFNRFNGVRRALFAPLLLVLYCCPMGSVNAAGPDLHVEALQSALTAVLTSRTFSKTPRLVALLEYLCVRYFQGDTESIKEYNIATDVFGRAADFDQASDAIVRVEVHRLRKKLKEFYAGEGVEQALEIVIQSGHYLPEFVVRRKRSENH
ncbi:MAG: hypothetical protein ACR2JB_26125 [Bryobacteraceae bacterium]